MFSSRFFLQSRSISVKMHKKAKGAIRAATMESQSPQDQFASHIMRDGLKARATKFIEQAVEHMISAGKSASDFAVALDKLAPYVKTGTYRRGRRNVPYPEPLNQRQSRRIAIDWISTQTKKTKRPGLGIRIGNELLAVLDDTTTLMAKRESMHKQAVSNRSNVIVGDRKKTGFSR